METSVLYYGDNLDILRKYISDGAIDLVYLDPPFNSKATYNVLFREPTGEPSEAQIRAFEDTWHWTATTEKTFQEIVDTAPPTVVEMIRALRAFVGRNDMMAYLTEMCIRLLELRRVLKETGSIYLHCDPTASHYLKVVMDTIFGARNFRNEIIWTYQKWGRKLAIKFQYQHQIILFYGKTSHARMQNYPTRSWESRDEYVRVRKQKVRLDLDKDNREYVLSDAGKGRRIKRYLDEAMVYGVPVGDVWDDIPALTSSAKERLGFETQKPLKLLERIIKASSNEGDIVLDPFCGCGTALVAAEALGRKWIGIDITHLAIGIMKWRLEKMFPGIHYKLTGEPKDLASARELASQNRYQFQWWALSLIGARPYGDDKKKGADTGIDGICYFMNEKERPKKALVQVKSGKVSVKDIRDLGHVIDREKAAIGIFLTLRPPSRNMREEAVKKGFYRSPQNIDYPRIQILTVEECLQGKKPELPPWVSPIPTPSAVKKTIRQKSLPL